LIGIEEEMLRKKLASCPGRNVVGMMSYVPDVNSIGRTMKPDLKKMSVLLVKAKYKNLFWVIGKEEQIYRKIKTTIEYISFLPVWA
jgi:hypothetical protein